MFTRNRKRQKRIAIFIAGLMIAAIVFGAFAPFIYGAEINKTDDTITIEGTVGFDQKYKIGGYTPFFIQFKNEGKDFQGEIQVKILQQKEGNREYYVLYSKSVELPVNSVKNIEMIIPLPMMQKTFTISIMESNGQERASKIIYANPQPYERVFVGLLSNQAEALNYMKSLRIQMSNRSDEMLLGDGLIHLNEDTFPEQYEILQNYDMIVMNDFDTSLLNEKQMDTLKLWNKNGGTLVMGLGPNGSKVLKAFQDDLNMKKQDQYKEEYDVSPLLENSSHFFIPQASLYLNTVEFIDGISVVSSERTQYVSLIEQGQGNILAYHFDLGLQPFTDWPGNVEFLTKMFRSYAPAFRMSQEQREYMQYLYNDPYSLRYIPSQNDQLFKWVLMIIAVYIALVGPGLYMYLKKRNKREKAWVIIPAISIVTFVMIYLLSLPMGYGEVIGSSTALIELQEDGSLGSIHVGAGFFNPHKGELNIKLPEGIKAKVGMEGRNYYTVEAQQNVITAKVQMTDAPSITFYPDKIWDFNYIQGEAVEQFQEEGIHSQLFLNGNYLEGTITNQMGFDLENPILSISNLQYEKLDAIKNGETKTVQIQIKDKNADRYQMLRDLFVDIDDRNVFIERMKNEESKDQLQRKSKRRQIFENYLNNARIGYTTISSGSNLVMNESAVTLYGFNSKNYMEGLEVNHKKVEMFNENMIIAPIQLGFSQSKKIEVPYGFIEPSDISGDGSYALDDYNQSIFVKEGGNLEITYKVDMDMDVTGFQLKWETLSHSNPIKESFIYNQDINEWEILQNDIYENPDAYISKDQVIRIRFSVEDGSEIKYPMIRLEGVGK